MTEHIEIVKSKLSLEERLAQLAEEATELSQAALKLRRTLNKSNPTPVTPAEAYGNLIEEVADVLLCLRVINFDTQKSEVEAVQNRKVKRWASRLESAGITNGDS